MSARYPGLEPTRLIHESVRRLIDRMVSDLIEETRRRLDGAKPQSVDDIRRLGGPVVAFSEEMRDKERALKRFLFARMYRHERVMGAAGEAKQVVRRPLRCLSRRARASARGMARRRAGAHDSPETARLVADYIAGMTDLYAFDAHRRLTGSTSP